MVKDESELIKEKNQARRVLRVMGILRSTGEIDFKRLTLLDRAATACDIPVTGFVITVTPKITAKSQSATFRFIVIIRSTNRTKKREKEPK